MIQFAPISLIGVSIPFQNRGKLQVCHTRKNGDTSLVFVSKKPRHLGYFRCQKTDRLNEIIGKEINGPVDMVVVELNTNNVLVDRIVVNQMERKPRAGSQEKEIHIEKEGWNLLRYVVVDYCGSPIGIIVANDPTDPSILNYDKVFIRDFIPSGVAFLLKGEYDIVGNFILHTLQLQSWEKTMDCHSPGKRLMPASFKVRTVPRNGDDDATEDILDPDFGEAAIGRVVPIDSGLWWIILLRAYGKFTGDLFIQEKTDVQTGIKMILKLCLSYEFDMFPTLLVTDGSCMIDHRMGIHGHPLEIQALFYSALRCAREMLKMALQTSYKH